MDKIKAALLVLRKYHFWVLCVAMLILSLALWKVATATLNKQFDEHKSKKSGTHKSVLGINNDHPNDLTLEKDKEQIKTIKSDVFRAWSFMYDEQKKNNPWPKELTKEMVDTMTLKKPGTRISVSFRDQYRIFIKKHVEVLPDIIDRYHPVLPETEGDSHETGMARMGLNESSLKDAKWVGLVAWEDTDFKRVASGFQWPARPSSRQVWFAQEDLWVYEALLNIIKQTNVDAGATSHHKATIKRIEKLEIGKQAVESIATTENPIIRSSGMVLAPMSGDEGMSGQTVGGGVIVVSPDDQLRDNRYVDQNGLPLTYKATPPFPQFKMMPIRMVLTMDQRRISELLANCANSAMRVEVRRVRLQPDQGKTMDMKAFEAIAAPTTTPSAGTEGQPMDSTFGGSHFEGTSFDGGSVGGMSSGPGRDKKTHGPNDMTVDIQGFIYIFNPPDSDTLGTGDTGEEEKSETESTNQGPSDETTSTETVSPVAE